MDLAYRLEGVRHCYGNKTVLCIDEQAIELNRIVGIVGHNGSGKSTLLRLLALLEHPTRGKVHYFAESKEPMFEIALLPQEPYLLRRSVFSNVSYGLEIRGCGKNEIRQRVYDALSWVGLDPEGFACRRWYALSGGEAQRVALAARLVLRPRVLLLDEPTTSVDAESGRKIREAILKARNEWGTTVIVSSHDRQWLFDVCDTIIHLFRGRVVGSGVENIVFGPWRKLEGDLWIKIFPDGQKFLCPGVPGCNAVGLIDPSDMHMFPEATGSKYKRRACCIHGTVSGLSMVRSTGDIIATVYAGGEPFSAKVSGCVEQFTPGRRVILLAYPDKIRWMS
ncbi:MAG: ABC transporter ATP-binding protein [Deltaproteobacteria bacterium]|nr:ABC transporter ATP-binding protein [Deltaproteobacteria bacterium]MBW2068103.1 ABC transporter ATP-binding protein [Deltaproteobacteria bacterium]